MVGSPDERISFVPTAAEIGAATGGASFAERTLTFYEETSPYPFVECPRCGSTRFVARPFDISQPDTIDPGMMVFAAECADCGVALRS